jgi:hypothetical protein
VLHYYNSLQIYISVVRFPHVLLTEVLSNYSKPFRYIERFNMAPKVFLYVQPP